MSKEKTAAAAVANKFERFKQRLKRTICGLIIALLLGILLITVGILFLVFFGKYWSDSTNWHRTLAYAGLAMLVLGLILAAIGIIVCIILYRVYKRSTSHEQPPMFKAGTYAPGTAPYPQQPPWPQATSQTDDQASIPLSGTTLTGPEADSTTAGDVKIEVTPHDKF